MKDVLKPTSSKAQLILLTVSCTIEIVKVIYQYDILDCYAVVDSTECLWSVAGYLWLGHYAPYQ